MTSSQDSEQYLTHDSQMYSFECTENSSAPRSSLDTPPGTQDGELPGRLPPL